MEKAIFELSNIEKSFGGIKVLHGLSLTMKRGERIGLSGGNGAGKSTLLNIATGFTFVDSGKIWCDGNDISGFPPWKFSRTGIRRSFQDVRMYPTLTIKEQFFVKNTVIRESFELIAEAGLVPFLHQFPNDVPLTILRKVEVVRALLSKPKIIYLDEPSAGFSNDELYNFSMFLNSFIDKTTTIVIVEHRLDLIKEVAGTTYELKGGSLEEVEL